MRISVQLIELRKHARRLIELATTKDDEWRDDIPEDLIEVFEFLDDITDKF